jgi:hypothetical protein
MCMQMLRPKHLCFRHASSYDTQGDAEDRILTGFVMMKFPIHSLTGQHSRASYDTQALTTRKGCR